MKKEKGSVTLFVLIVCMFMLIILLLVNLGIMNTKTSQEKEIEEISKIYAVNEDDLATTYTSIVNENEYATIGKTTQLINAANTELETKIMDLLSPTEYIQPTAVNGVTISRGGYVVIGKLVIVNMAIRIDTSVLTISENCNLRTKVLTGLPVPITSSCISAIYPFKDSKGTGYYGTPAYADVLTEGSIAISVNGDQPYTTNWGIVMNGVYIAQ